MATKGIDISFYQDEVNYAKAAKEISFVILREGYKTNIDSEFLNHVKGFTAQKVPIHGVYHFIYATTKAGAIEEAKSCIANIKKAKLPKTCMVWADLEYDTISQAKKQGIDFTNDMINEFTLAFCDYVKSKGYPVGVYMNNDFYKHYYYKETIKKYPIWLADYTGEPNQDCLYQQYTSSGKVSGIYGEVDMDYYLGADDAEYLANNTGISVNPSDGTIEKAISWMESLAANDAHGYDQIYRWGEKGDYDCSSAVITAWEVAGVPVKTVGGATYTGNMYDAFLSHGFTDVSSTINFTTGKNLERGDVLLNHVHHVAMYCGGGLEVEASINEKGGAKNGTPGDQTGKEILIRSYRNYPWDVVLRYTDSKSNTNSLLQIGSTGTAVEELQKKLKGLGYKIKVDGDFGEKTEKKVLHFQKKYKLEVDGIVGPITQGKIDEVLSTITQDKTKKYTGIVTANSLNVRSGPSTSYDKVGKLQSGAKVDVCGSLSGLDGSVWLYICFNGNSYGYVLSEYVEAA